jgi:hypothetical protein
VGCQKAELQGCRKESGKEWEAIAPVSVQTHFLVSYQNFTLLLEKSGGEICRVWLMMPR